VNILALAKDSILSNQVCTNTDYNIIHGFLSQLKINSEKTKIFYENVLVDFYLFWGNQWNELSIGYCQGYVDYLMRVKVFKLFSQVSLNQKINILFQFVTFLHNMDIISDECLTPFKEYQENQKTLSTEKSKLRKGKTTKEIKLPEIMSEFLLYLKNNDYSQIKQYKKQLVPFERFLESNGVNSNVFLEGDKETILFEQIGKFEKQITSRVSSEEIILSTATIYLRAVQLFVKYLYSKKLVNKKYTIPLRLRGRAKRANEYVPEERIIELMNFIYESNHVIRDLSIFLIIVDTGCRPIEVCNLTLMDIDQIERTLSFECGKTEKRKVKISKEVMDVLKDYLQIRSEYNPKTDNLFISCSGNALTPSGINTIFYTANLKAFGESLYPAKAFRHTYITNALEEHSFERVSQIIGHKDWKSTYYYYYRSKKRLLTNTLSKSPLEEMRG
jgi:integrase/recombinase XerC